MAESGRKVWLWATVTRFFTVFTIAQNRSGKIARVLYGDQGRVDGLVEGHPFGVQRRLDHPGVEDVVERKDVGLAKRFDLF